VKHEIIFTQIFQKSCKKYKKVKSSFCLTMYHATKMYPLLGPML